LGYVIFVAAQALAMRTKKTASKAVLKIPVDDTPQPDSQGSSAQLFCN